MWKSTLRLMAYATALTLASCSSDQGVNAVTDPLAGEVVLLGSSALGASAPVRILGASVKGDVLLVQAEYSGGCAEHRFQLVADDAFMESFPVQMVIRLLHDDGDDPCDGILSSELGFGLTPLARAYEAAYRTNSGTIVLHLEGWGESLRYEF